MKSLSAILIPLLALLGSSTLSAQLLPTAQGTALATPTATAPKPSSVYDSVLRIEVSTQQADYQTPWNAGKFSGGIGTGFIIGKNRIMTNAHVVSNARRILITTHNSSQKHPARVLHIAHDCDLAILELEDFSPFANYPVFEFGGIPELESTVRTIGYPVGGERLSVTRGVVSRIDFRPYSHSRVDSHLIVQIDAAINPGNSGGPVLQEGKVIGVAFQGLTQADNTGFIIPIPVVKRFLADIEDGQYDTYTSLGLATFPLHNPAMRKALGLAQGASGVLVSAVILDGPCQDKIQQHDVLTSIDGNAIDSGGSIYIDGQRVNLNEVVERKLSGESVTLEVFRNGAITKHEVIVKPNPASRIYANQYGKRPRYVFCAGLTFQPLDRNLYSAHRFNSSRVRKVYSSYIADGLFKDLQDIVVITRIENDRLTNFIQGFRGTIVESINDEPINSLQEVNDILYAAEPPEFFVIRCNGIPRPIVIPSAEITAANERMSATYGIPKLSNLKED